MFYMRFDFSIILSNTIYQPSYPNLVLLSIKLIRCQSQRDIYIIIYSVPLNATSIYYIYIYKIGFITIQFDILTFDIIYEEKIHYTFAHY